MSVAFDIATAIMATILLLAGALTLYATTKHQALLASAAPRRVGRIGGLLVASALVGFLNIAGPATAVFIWITGLMLVWSLVPILAKWLRWRAEEGR